MKQLIVVVVLFIVCAAAQNMSDTMADLPASQANFTESRNGSSYEPIPLDRLGNASDHGNSPMMMRGGLDVSKLPGFGVKTCVAAETGKTFYPGESTDEHDKCNTCFCTDDGWSCTKMACGTVELQPVQKCIADKTKKEFYPGESTREHDGCNRCTCQKDGGWACTRMSCETAPPTLIEAEKPANKCIAHKTGREFNAGEMTKEHDNCNNCICMEDGGWMCTKMACVTLPELKPVPNPSPKAHCDVMDCGHSPSSYENPVCGSDRKTYSNRCEMTKAACYKGEAITLIRSGRCEDFSEDQLCVFPCPYNRHFPRVCASNGRVYGDECMLRGYSCIYQKPFSVTTQYRFEDSFNRTDCENCNFDCTEPTQSPLSIGWGLGPEKDRKGMYGTICGSDGVTYDNDCNMWQKACKTKTAIMRLYDGECGNPVNANGMRIIPM